MAFWQKDKVATTASGVTIRSIREDRPKSNAIDSPAFWFVVSFVLAGATLCAAHYIDLWVAALMLFNTMVASANFGSKCVFNILNGQSPPLK